MTMPDASIGTSFEVELQARLSDGRRHFALDIRFQAAAPVVALYGASGAGKSLTLQGIAGLLPGCQGRVRVAGETLLDSSAGLDRPAAARSLGVLFQHYALFPHLSVRDNVGFALTRWWDRRLRGADAERVDALLESLGLSALTHSRPRHLSGGQQQRVALARALAGRPRALLLDEPFAALHPRLRRQLREELRSVCARYAIPVLMVTHDVDDVLALADLAFLIDEGRVQREVDLRRGLAQDRLDGLAVTPDSPEQARLRGLLAS
jgi:molybdate transport system ATP-binding protein